MIEKKRNFYLRFWDIKHIDRDGKIDLSDAVMGLHALVGMNSYDVNLRDIVFGMKFISEWK